MSHLIPSQTQVLQNKRRIIELEARFLQLQNELAEFRDLIVPLAEHHAETDRPMMPGFRMSIPGRKTKT